MPTYYITRRWTTQEYFTIEAPTAEEASFIVGQKEPDWETADRDYEGIKIQNAEDGQIELDFGEEF